MIYWLVKIMSYINIGDYNGKKLPVKKYADYLKAVSLNANTKVLTLILNSMVPG